MIYGSVCSGIEAATSAWHPLGWKPAFFSEIEKFPCAVLKHHYPDVPNLGDMTKFKEWPDDTTLDVLVGGTPCQSFSIAGLRKGLDDPRGNLMLTFGAIAAKYRPTWLVWENVPGVLSSNGGRDFGTFLGMLGELGYGFAYRVLDAQYFGLAQRRKRVFVVGCLGDWRSAAAVLLESESMSGNPPPSRKKGQTAPTIPSRSTAGGGLGTDFDCDGGLINSWPKDVAPTLNAHFGDKMGLENQHALNGGGFSCPEVANPLTARMAKGMNTTLDEGQTPIVTTGGVFDEDTPISIRTAQTSSNGCGINTEGTAYTLDGAQGQAVYSIMPMNSGKDYKARKVDVSQPLMAGGPVGGNQGGDVVAYGFQPRIGRNGRGDMGDVVSALNAQSGETGRGDAAPCVAIAENQKGEIRTSQVTNTLNSAGGKPGRGYQAAMIGSAVRRLTPKECERLMGFPDGHTQIPWRGKPAEDCPDGPRYKALGNSMAVPVMAWIGKRIEAVAAIKKEAAE